MAQRFLPEESSRLAPTRIGPHEISEYGKPYVIAEIGVNHGGCLERAKKLIDAACEAGADAVKFQVFSAHALVTTQAGLADYQAGGPAGSQLELLSAVELSPQDFQQLAHHCRDMGIAFLATPFSNEDLEVVLDLGVSAIKIASTDLNNFPLLDAAMGSELPLLLSTGASCLTEIDETISFLRGKHACERLILLHCVSSYPTAIEDAALSTIAQLRKRYGIWSGYSDHTESIEVAGLAVACGARVLEKHFTLNRDSDGPDQSFSLTPAMFKQYVHSAELAWRMLGEPRTDVADAERQVRALARKSVVAKAAILKGARITSDLLTLKRPGGGIEPKDADQLVGKTAKTNIQADTQIAWDMVC